MATIGGFWSYVHADDDAESGRITQLARDVRAQFEMLTGESIDLFLDRDQLQWGDDWKPKIDGSLASIAFFVPVITPRFFQSKECRRELDFFARRAERLGVKELVLPLLWVDFPKLHEETPADDLVGLVQRFQWSDWTDLKFEERGSGEYRRAVAALAERLVQANAAADASLRDLDLTSAATAQDQEDELGALDKLGAMEESLPQLSDILADVGETIESIGRAMQSATEDIQGNTNPRAELANRLRVARALSDRLTEPSTSIRNLGGDFSASLKRVDEGVRIILDRVPEEVESSSEARGEFESFFRSVRSMVAQAELGMNAVSGMIDQIAPLERMSRDLRKPLRALREGLTLFVDGLSIMRDWVRLIDEVELELMSQSDD